MFAILAIYSAFCVLHFDFFFFWSVDVVSPAD
jgi:hypothetical protein